MRWTQALIPTLKEDPQDAEVISHKLMVRGGFVRRLGSGTYSYLPLGVRVLEKVKRIIREELDGALAQEVLLPAIHPPEIWKRTGRYDILGPVLIKFRDRHNRECVLGPTHEEIITDLVANNVKSYKSLPLTLYQIQTKFRDEPRPRFGIMRTSEFIMKDAYSFDCDEAGLDKSYAKMYDAYCRIFARCGLPYIPVEADTGIMGGNVSHEFMVPSEAGEDTIVVCGSCKYAASTQIAKCDMSQGSGSGIQGSGEVQQIAKEVNTPGVSTIEKVAALLKVSPAKLIKTLILSTDQGVVALLVRGDYEANDVKLKNYLKCATLELADEKTIFKVTGAPVGFSGPVGLKDVRLVADESVRGMVNAVVGANKKDAHLVGVKVGRDFTVSEFGDFRVITKDDPCPKCGKSVNITKSIEIGHTFKLGTKYSETLGAKYLDKDGTTKTIIMGCYGIGVNRILASLIESSNDKDGIIWPISIAPYQILLTALKIESEVVKKAADSIYDQLTKAGYEVLYDDRAESAGVKFKDGDLVGIPIKIVVGDRGLAKGVVEMKSRKTGQAHEVALHDVESRVKDIIFGSAA